MATLPGASNTLADGASSSVGGSDLITVIAPVATSADSTPRVYGSAAAVYAQHGYCEGVEYANYHSNEAALPILFVGIPIVTPGAVGRHNTSGNTGTSVTTITAGSGGVLCGHDGKFTVIVGGTVGTDQIVLGLSLDDGLTTQRIRLGTATSYVVPYFNITFAATVGTLVTGDTIHTWHGSGPRGAAAGWTLAFAALAAQQKQCRTVLNIGDFQTNTEVAAMLVLLNAYDTSADRFVRMRGSVVDRLPLAALSSASHRMSTSNVTFAEVGATGDTIVRATGSWATDGFATGDLLTISGSASNDGTLAAACVVTNSKTITLDTDDLLDEGPVANVTITAEASLTFSGSTDAVTRAGGNPGSWLDDGFRVGDSVTISGTVSNDGTCTVTDVTATVLTFESGDLADEVIGSTVATIAAGQTKAAWMTAIETEFATIDDDEHIDLSAGRARKYSTFTGWHLRHPAAWAASLREYQHDLHIATWRKSDGPTGWSLNDADGTLVEYDDRVDGAAASAARFTSFRTWANGPSGAFISNSLTRASDSSLLVQSHNTDVVNRARTICQAATEHAIGKSLILNSDGTATPAARAEVESYVNGSLSNDLLANVKGEGPRASNVTWTMSSVDVLNVAEPIVNGTLTLYIRGTIHTINTLTVVG